MATESVSRTSTTRTTTTAGGATAAAPRPQRTRGRVVRGLGRGRGAGVIVGSRPLVPVSVVPEELVNQVNCYYLIDKRPP